VTTPVPRSTLLVKTVTVPFCATASQESRLVASGSPGACNGLAESSRKRTKEAEAYDESTGPFENLPAGDRFGSHLRRSLIKLSLWRRGGSRG